MDRFPLSFRAALIACIAIGTTGLCATATAAQGAPEAEPLQVFARFKSALDANDLTAAEQHARQLVSVTETKYGPQARELVNPLTNLGTVHFRRGEFAQAEAAYQRAIKLIEGQLSGADRLLIRPLEGMGETWLASGRPAEAEIALRRAVDLSRNLDGLYNSAQLDTVDALIEAFEANGKRAEAEREHQFAFRIAETTFGKRDLRLLEPLDRYGRWYESVGRYSTARGLHARALQLAEELSADKPIVGVPALRGMARTWLLEAIYGPEVEAQPMTEFDDSPDPFLVGRNQSRLNPEGVRALNYSIELIRRATPVDQRLLGDTLAQLGDWYLIAGNAGRANDAYAESYKALAAVSEDAKSLLSSPRLLVYRPPASSLTRMQPADPEGYAIKDVDMRLQIDRSGKVADVTVVNSSAPENSTKAAVLAARRARFAPRISSGEPIDTDGVMLRERMLVKAQPEKSTPAPQASTPD